jgi:hypothetical protein
MWFPIGWLSLGFALKWIREAYEKFSEKWGNKMFNFIYTILSFALVIVLVGVLKVTWYMLIICLMFWVTVCALVKAD